MSSPRGEMEKGQSFLKSVSWPNESLVAKHFRLERKHRITTITHGLANRCLTIRLSAPDVSLSFQSANHSFTLVWAPRDGVMTHPVIIRPYESRTLPVTTMPPMLPLHQSARPASLSWLSTTFRALSRVEYSSYHTLSSGFEPESPSLCAANVTPYTN